MPWTSARTASPIVSMLRSIRSIRSSVGKRCAGVCAAAVGVATASDAIGISGDCLGGRRRNPAARSPTATAGCPLAAAAGSTVPVGPVHLRRVRALHGCTINDALLALVAGALRHWLMRRDGDVERRTVRALVPVNRRQVGDPGLGRNQLSGYVCELPIGEPNPIKRLQKIRSAMDRHKAAGPRRGAGAFALLANHVPRAVLRIAMPAVAGLAPLLYDLVISNVPLPAIRLALGGAELHEVYPLVPLASGHAMSVAACSYGGAVCLGIYAEPRTVPDLADFADFLEPALDDLTDGFHRMCLRPGRT